MSLFGGKGGGGEAKRARREEAARQARIRTGTAKIDETFGQFDDDFFSERRTAYEQFAMPQLETQYKDAAEALTFDLARRGQLESSTRADKTSELEELYNRNRRSITDQAIGQETEARNAVEDARGDLLRNLQSTADANATANQSIARAEALSKPVPFSPLTQLFADFTSALGQQAGYERAGAIDPRFGGRFNTGLFGPSNNAVRVT